jgi:hypothetical protein
VSHKKLQHVARERDEDQRAEFIAQMAMYSPEELGFIDEVSRDEWVVGRHYGRARKGLHTRKTQPFVCGQRTSTIRVLSIDGFVCGMSVEGSFTKPVFLKWLEFSVVHTALFFVLGAVLTTLQLPKCSAYPSPLSVLVLDNALIHHNKEILILADRFGVRIEYLPPYSPDLNPIEEAFSKIKSFIHRNQDYYYTKDGEDGHGILYDMFEVLDIITSEDAASYIVHAGYF